MECFTLFLGFLFLFSVCFAQPSAVITGSSSPVSTAPSVVIIGSNTSVSMASSIVYLNSTDLPSVWYNNNSINMTLNGNDGSVIRVVLSRRQNIGFACGFYCIDSCKYYLFSVVVGGGGDPSVVWSANRNNPVSENATLQLTRGGGLVLRDSEGTKVWSTNTSGNSVLGMNITESGNLLLFVDKGRVVWQSFDHPNDTLLPGQRLNEGQRLSVSANRSNWSDGLYYATLTSKTGFSAYTLVDGGPPLMYYQLTLNGSSRSNDGSNYAEFQRVGLFLKLGMSEETFLRYPISFPFESVIVYLRLESDGHLMDIVGQDLGECQYPRICGKYGVCREGQCTCPLTSDGVQYFSVAQFQLPDRGCSRNTPLSCQPFPDQHHLIQVPNTTYFSTIDSDAALLNIRTLEDCKQACLRNCS